MKWRKRGFQTAFKEKLFPHKDSQAIEHGSQRGGLVTMLVFKTGLDKDVSSLVWSYCWPSFQQEVGLETFRAAFQHEWFLWSCWSGGHLCCLLWNGYRHKLIKGYSQEKKKSSFPKNSHKSLSLSRYKRGEAFSFFKLIKENERKLFRNGHAY